MRALLIDAPSTGPDTTGLHILPLPVPGPTDVTIDVAYAGINYLDVMARRGDAGYVQHWPYAPGLEVAGTVRAVGSHVDGLTAGQPVVALTTGGGYAEVVRVPAALTVPLAAGVDLDLAATVPLTVSTALLLITDAARVQAGDTVLVQSAGGGLGHALAQLLPLYGCSQLIGTVGQASKEEAAQNAGFDLVLSREDGEFESFAAQSPGACQVILDPLGTALLDTDLRVAAQGARVVLFGNPSGEPFGPLPPAPRLLAGNIAVGGFSLRALAARAPHRVRWAMECSLAHLAARRLQLPRPSAVELADIPEIHQRMASGHSTGKFVARITS
ncbi:quinone oxidoreductase family protein [Deinococcus sonorensis]|uniref:Zinc-binding alcohol dehydrogenase family protein n=1 Tax=Deinococcus sonorensis TaxID=309891 RepID=A0ABV8Y8F5_9DEIO